MLKDHGYTYIVAWGKMLGSSASYIQDECDRAAADKAPKNATYRNSNGTWETTDGITSQSTRSTLGLPPLPPTDPAVLAEYDGQLIDKVQAQGKDNFQYRIQFGSVGRAALWAERNGLSENVLAVTPDDILSLVEPVVVQYLPE